MKVITENKYTISLVKNSDCIDVYYHEFPNLRVFEKVFLVFKIKNDFICYLNKNLWKQDNFPYRVGQFKTIPLRIYVKYLF